MSWKRALPVAGAGTLLMMVTSVVARADLLPPGDEVSQPSPSASAQVRPPSSAPPLTAVPTASAPPRPDDATGAFVPTEGGGDIASGEVLLVQAYAAMWILAFGLVLGSVARQRKLDARITSLESDLAAARGATVEGGHGGSEETGLDDPEVDEGS